VWRLPCLNFQTTIGSDMQLCCVPLELVGTIYAKSRAWR